MQTVTERRRKYWVDREVQGAILRQTVRYWLFASVMFTFVILVYRIAPHFLSGEPLQFSRLWYHLAPMAVSSAMLFPIVMFSAVRFSNRFAGPMARFRRTLTQLADGEATSVVELRRDDFWSDVANQLNRVSAKFRELSVTLPEPDEMVEEVH